jgi:hypothetical protein
VYIFVDHKKHDIKLWWIPFVGNFCIGLSFYLYLREDKRR